MCMKELDKQIVYLKEERSKIEKERNRYLDILFDAEDPQEMGHLTDEEEKSIYNSLEQLDEKKVDLENQMISLIDQIHPEIKGLDHFNICPHGIKIFGYELIYKCPELLEKKDNINIIYSYIKGEIRKDYSVYYGENDYNEKRAREILQLSPFILIDEKLYVYLENDSFSLMHGIHGILCSDILVQDGEIRKELDKMLKNNKLSYYTSEGYKCYISPNVQLMEKILTNIPSISREFLLRCSDETYYKEHIDDLKLIKDICSIYHLYNYDNYGENEKLVIDWDIYGSTLHDIFEIFSGIKPIDNVHLESIDDEIERMRLSILLRCCERDIFIHFQKIKNDYILENPFVMIAMLKAQSTLMQDKLLQFLKIKEIREEIQNKDGFYYPFLIERIGELRNASYGSVDDMFYDINEKVSTIKEQLVHYFDSYGLEYIYFYYGEKMCRMPITFYRQFSQNAFLGDYLGQCTDEYQEDNFFCQFDIIGYLIEDNYIRAAKDIMRMGISQPIDYDLDNEIYWNQLFIQYYHEQIDEQLETCMQKVKQS